MSNNNSNIVFWMGISVAVGILIGSLFDYQKKGFQLISNNKQENKIKRLINYIQYDYVDEIDTDSLLDGAINNLLSNLDPHSVYIPKEELQKIQESMDGKFKGIGVQFKLIRDSVTVLGVIKDGPGEKAGILAGDRILIADKDTLYGKFLNSNQVMSILKGSEDNVAMTIYRKQLDSILEFNFKRGEVNITSVPVYYMINDSIGYIKTERFARNTYKEFQNALKELRQNGLQTLIVDLRGNTGGFMNVANQIADEFLENDKLIVFTKNKRKKIDESYATSKGDFEKGKLYILIDEESASASEIVAGAIQDNDRGTIVGRRSFGKGLVQQEMDLGDGSAVRLTTARYYTPTGRSIQKPYNHKGNKSYFDDTFYRLQHGELLNKDSIPKVDSLKYTTPKGKIVYGGGGIIPDIFVPIDTTAYLPQYHLSKINNFVFEYIDNNRKKYSKMSWNEFNDNFDVDDLFDSYNKSSNHAFQSSFQNASLFKNYLKALAARELFGDAGFYKIYQLNDKMIEKVVELENSTFAK